MAPDKKRRKKKSRTQDFSSDSDDSSDGESFTPQSQSEPQKQTHKFEMLNMHLPAVHIQDESAQLDEQYEQKKDLERFSSFTDAEFQAFYQRYVTQQLGEDLNALRQSKDFGDKSLPLIIDALKIGANIYDEKERAMILNSE